MCDLCSNYGVQTVALKIKGKQTEVCFDCIERKTYA